MPIRSSEYFSYAGVLSSDMGIRNVNLDTGMLEEPFMSTREIVEIKIPGRDEPYFQRVEQAPLEFTVSFLFDNGFDEAKTRATARWLKQTYYQPLWFSDNPNRIYYAMVVNDSKLVHNCLSEGYVTLTFRCNSPYAYSPVYTSEEFYMTTKYLTKTESTTTDFQSGTLTDVDVQP